jgi:Ni/Fe-hydrogenase subunit HybB-like protein
MIFEIMLQLIALSVIQKIGRHITDPQFAISVKMKNNMYVYVYMYVCMYVCMYVWERERERERENAPVRT